MCNRYVDGARFWRPTRRLRLLLQYPFDSLATVTLKSLRRKHWPVFLASMALVLVSWGITPLQAAIFATDTITKTSIENLTVSTALLPVDKQLTELTANYSYSVFSIAWLDERLPPYMSHDAVLVPFQLEAAQSGEDNETWTAMTTMYSVDVSCEPANLQNKTLTALDSGTTTMLYYTSSYGCSIPYPYGPTGNDTVGRTGEEAIKEYSALYAGYQDHDGLADYYISQYCPRNASNVFLASSRRISSERATRRQHPQYYSANPRTTARTSQRQSPGRIEAY
jgi:hypothetical protein